MTEYIEVILKQTYYITLPPLTKSSRTQFGKDIIGEIQDHFKTYNQNSYIHQYIYIHRTSIINSSIRKAD